METFTDSEYQFFIVDNLLATDQKFQVGIYGRSKKTVENAASDDFGSNLWRTVQKRESHEILYPYWGQLSVALR